MISFFFFRSDFFSNIYWTLSGYIIMPTTLIMTSYDFGILRVSWCLSWHLFLRQLIRCMSVNGLQSRLSHITQLYLGQRTERARLKLHHCSGNRNETQAASLQRQQNWDSSCFTAAAAGMTRDCSTAVAMMGRRLELLHLSGDKIKRLELLHCSGAVSDEQHASGWLCRIVTADREPGVDSPLVSTSRGPRLCFFWGTTTRIQMNNK